MILSNHHNGGVSCTYLNPDRNSAHPSSMIKSEIAWRHPLENQSATITWDMRTVLDTTNPLSPTAYVNYNHTCYPAHQVKVNGAVIYSYIPPDNSPSYLFTCLVRHDYMRVGVTQSTAVPAH